MSAMHLTRAPSGSQPLLSVQKLRKYFLYKPSPLQKDEIVQAVDGVSFSVERGETVGIVGESGCGKSTTAKLLMHLISPDEGAILFEGRRVGSRSDMTVRDLRQKMQMVFQDSYASLNPRASILDVIAFGPRAHGQSRAAARRRARELLAQVGLEPDRFANRFPHELSGGQRQRVNIARALALQPEILILDEAVSALDKSIEAQILNLLMDLRDKYSLSYLFISHDLNVIRLLSDRVIVMYLGEIVEYGVVGEIYSSPRHPYTQALLSARPSFDPEHRVQAPPLSGDPPSPIRPPSGCRFHTRCPFAEPVCAEKKPPLEGDARRGVAVACHMYVRNSGHSRSADAIGRESRVSSE